MKNNQIEYYIDGVYKRDGEIQIRKKGKLKFVSNDGALALNINPGLDKFSIQSADIGKLISLDATPKGLPAHLVLSKNSNTAWLSLPGTP